MARIENVNIDGTNYDVGKIASTSNLGVVQVGSGLSITSAGVLSATGGTGGETMLVTISRSTIEDLPSIQWVWSSDYTFAQLTSNPEAVRVYVDDPCYRNEGTIKPTLAEAGQDGQAGVLELRWDYLGRIMDFRIYSPQEWEGQTVNPVFLDVRYYAYEYTTGLTVLPTLTLADNATSIPDGTTVTYSDSVAMYNEAGNFGCNNTYLCGSFRILPVRRKVGSDESSWVEEQCLITNASNRGSTSVSKDYVYLTFMFNGEHYKMTLTSDSYPYENFVITKMQ